MNEPVLIWGAGAIGGILGAYWARAGIQVLMVDIVSDHVTALPSARPARRCSKIDQRASRCLPPIRVLRPSRETSRYPSQL